MVYALGLVSCTICVALIIAVLSGWERTHIVAVVVVVLLFYINGKHLRSCRDGQLT